MASSRTCEACRPLTCEAHAQKIAHAVEVTRRAFFDAKKAMEDAEQHMRDNTRVHQSRRTLLSSAPHAETKAACAPCKAQGIASCAHVPPGKRACMILHDGLCRAFPQDTLEIIHASRSTDECKVFRLYA